MIKKTLIAFMFIATFSVVSCNSDDNSSEVNPYEKFKGTWTGTFIGDDEGTWRVTIDENGVATGTLESNTMTFPFDLEGQISENGEVNAIYKNGTTEVGTMTGTMTGTTASGTWESPLFEMEGTWEGSKN